MSKRARTGEVVTTFVTPVRAAKRPIDKDIIVIRKTALAGSQVSTTLITATFPCTITGLRWDLSAVTEAGTAPALWIWAIVKVTQGDTANSLSATDGATLYAPEQNCLVWGSRVVAPEDTIGAAESYNGTTKIMRKLLGGDQLLFITVGEATNTIECSGAIQFFCRT